jgi:ABC-type glucose/galactose transport system permease subunit
MGNLVGKVYVSCDCISELVAELVISWALWGCVTVGPYPFQVGVGEVESCEVRGLVVSVDAVSGVVFMYGRNLGDYRFAVCDDSMGSLCGECGC